MDNNNKLLTQSVNQLEANTQSLIASNQAKSGSSRSTDGSDTLISNRYDTKLNDNHITGSAVGLENLLKARASKDKNLVPGGSFHNDLFTNPENQLQAGYAGPAAALTVSTVIAREIINILERPSFKEAFVGLSDAEEARDKLVDDANRIYFLLRLAQMSFDASLDAKGYDFESLKTGWVKLFQQYADPEFALENISLTTILAGISKKQIPPRLQNLCRNYEKNNCRGGCRYTHKCMACLGDHPLRTCPSTHKNCKNELARVKS